LPRFGVMWSADDERHVSVSFAIRDVRVQLRLTLDAASRIVSFLIDRWGDPDNTGTWGLHPFGGEVRAYQTFDGLSIPSAGLVGWFFGTDRWPATAFFRYRITGLAVLGTKDSSPDL
jgi:hypothetical protein